MKKNNTLGYIHLTIEILRSTVLIISRCCNALLACALRTLITYFIFATQQSLGYSDDKWNAQIELESDAGNVMERPLYVKGLLPLIQLDNAMLFVDARASAVSNQDVKFGKYDLGVGIRTIVNDEVAFGLYGYIDSFLYSGSTFSQFMIGAEALAEQWETRLNIYLPEPLEGDKFTKTTFSSTGYCAVDLSSLGITTYKTVASSYKGLEFEFGARDTISSSHTLGIFMGYYTFSSTGSDDLEELSFSGPRGRIEVIRENDTDGSRLSIGVQVQHDKVWGMQAFGFVKMELELGESENRRRLTPVERRMTEFVRKDDVINVNSVTTSSFSSMFTHLNSYLSTQLNHAPFSSIFLVRAGDNLSSIVTNAGPNSLIILNGSDGAINTITPVTLLPDQVIIGAMLLDNIPGLSGTCLASRSRPLVHDFQMFGTIAGNSTFLLNNDNSIIGIDIAVDSTTLAAIYGNNITNAALSDINISTMGNGVSLNNDTDTTISQVNVNGAQVVLYSLVSTMSVVERFAFSFNNSNNPSITEVQIQNIDIGLSLSGTNYANISAVSMDNISTTLMYVFGGSNLTAYTIYSSTDTISDTIVSIDSASLAQISNWTHTGSANTGFMINNSNGSIINNISIDNINSSALSGSCNANLIVDTITVTNLVDRVVSLSDTKDSVISAINITNASYAAGVSALQITNGHDLKIQDITIGGTVYTGLEIAGSRRIHTTNISINEAVEDIIDVHDTTGPISITHITAGTSLNTIDVNNAIDVHIHNVIPIRDAILLGAINVESSENINIANPSDSIVAFAGFIDSNNTSFTYENLNFASSTSSTFSLPTPLAQIIGSTGSVGNNISVSADDQALYISGGMGNSISNLTVSSTGTAITLDGTTDLSINDVSNQAGQPIPTLGIYLVNNNSGSINGINFDSIDTIIQIDSNTEAFSITNATITHTTPQNPLNPAIYVTGALSNFTINGLNLNNINGANVIAFETGELIDNILMTAVSASNVANFITINAPISTEMSNITMNNISVTNMLGSFVSLDEFTGSASASNIVISDSTIYGTNGVMQSLFDIGGTINTDSITVTNSNLSYIERLVSVADNVNATHTSIIVDGNTITGSTNTMYVNGVSTIDSLTIQNNSFINSGTEVGGASNTMAVEGSPTIITATIKNNSFSNSPIMPLSGSTLTSVLFITGAPNIGTFVIEGNSTPNVTQEIVHLQGITNRAFGNFIIDAGTGTPVSGVAVLDIDGCTDLSFDNIEILGNESIGIRIENNSSTISWTNLEISASDIAIQIINNNGSSITLEDVSSPSITLANVVLSGALTSIDVENSHDVTITNVTAAPGLNLGSITTSGSTNVIIDNSALPAISYFSNIDLTNTTNVQLYNLGINSYDPVAFSINGINGLTLNNFDIAGAPIKGLVIEGGNQNIQIDNISINATNTNLTINDIDGTNVILNGVFVNQAANSLIVTSTNNLTITNLLPIHSGDILGAINVTQANNFTIDNSAATGLIYFDAINLTDSTNIGLQNVGINSNNTFGAALNINNVDGLALQNFTINGNAITGLTISNNSTNIDIQNITIHAAVDGLIMYGLNNTTNQINISGIILDSMPNALMIDTSENITLTNIIALNQSLGVGSALITNSTNITLDNSLLATQTNFTSVSASNSAGITLDNLGIINNNHYGATLSFSDISGGIINNLNILGNPSAGVAITGNTQNITINGATIEAITNGIYLDGGTYTMNNVTLNNIIMSNATNSITIGSAQNVSINGINSVSGGILGYASVSNASNIAIINTPSNFQYFDGIELAGSSAITLQNIGIDSNASIATALILEGMNGLNISNFIITGQAGTGLLIDNSGAINIQGITIDAITNGIIIQNSNMTPTLPYNVVISGAQLGNSINAISITNSSWIDIENTTPKVSGSNLGNISVTNSNNILVDEINGSTTAFNSLIDSGNTNFAYSNIIISPAVPAGIPVQIIGSTGSLATNLSVVSGINDAIKIQGSNNTTFIDPIVTSGGIAITIDNTSCTTLQNAAILGTPTTGLSIINGSYGVSVNALTSAGTPTTLFNINNANDIMIADAMANASSQNILAIVNAYDVSVNNTMGGNIGAIDISGGSYGIQITNPSNSTTIFSDVAISNSNAITMDYIQISNDDSMALSINDSFNITANNIVAGGAILVANASYNVTVNNATINAITDAIVANNLTGSGSNLTMSNVLVNSATNAVSINGSQNILITDLIPLPGDQLGYVNIVGSNNITIDDSAQPANVLMNGLYLSNSSAFILNNMGVDSSNISGTAVTLDNMSDITFNDFTILGTAGTGMQISNNSRNINLVDLVINATTNALVIDGLLSPASNVTINGLTVNYNATNAIIVDNSQNVSISNLQSPVTNDVGYINIDNSNNVSIDNSASPVLIRADGINLSSSYAIAIDNIGIYSSDSLGYGMSLDNMHDINLNNLFIDGIAMTGLLIENNSYNINLQNSIINATTNNIVIQNNSGVSGSINIAGVTADAATNLLTITNSQNVNISSIIPEITVVYSLGNVQIDSSSNVSLDNSMTTQITQINGLEIVGSDHITLLNMGVNSASLGGVAAMINNSNNITLSDFDIAGIADTGLLIENNTYAINISNMDIAAEQSNLVINNVNLPSANLNLSNITMNDATNAVTISGSANITITNMSLDPTVLDSVIGYINITGSNNVTIDNTITPSVTYVDGLYMDSSTNLDFINIGVNSSNSNGAAVTLSNMQNIDFSTININGTAMIGLLIQNDSQNVNVSGISISATTSAIVIEDITIAPSSGSNVTIQDVLIDQSQVPATIPNAITITNSGWIDVQNLAQALTSSGNLGLITTTDSHDISINDNNSTTTVFSGIMDQNNNNVSYANLVINQTTAPASSIIAPVQILSSTNVTASNLLVSGQEAVYIQGGANHVLDAITASANNATGATITIDGASYVSLINASISGSIESGLSIINAASYITIQSPQISDVFSSAVNIAGGSSNINISDLSADAMATNVYHINEGSNITLSDTIGNSIGGILIENDSFNINIVNPVNTTTTFDNVSIYDSHLISMQNIIVNSVATAMIIDNSWGVTADGIALACDTGLSVQNGSYNLMFSNFNIAAITNNILIDNLMGTGNNLTINGVIMNAATNAVDITNSQNITISGMQPNTGITGPIGYININGSNNINIDNSTEPAIVYVNGLNLTAGSSLLFDNIGVNSTNSTGAAVTLDNMSNIDLIDFGITGSAMTGLLISNNSQNINIQNISIQATTNSMVINNIDGLASGLHIAGVKVSDATNALVVTNANNVTVSALGPDTSGAIGNISISDSSNISVDNSTLSQTVFANSLNMNSSSNLLFSNLGITSNNTTGAAVTVSGMNGLELDAFRITGNAMTGLMISDNSQNITMTGLYIEATENNIVIQDITNIPALGYNITISGSTLTAATNAITITNSQWVKIDTINSGALGEINVSNSGNIDLMQPLASSTTFSALSDTSNTNFAYSNITVVQPTVSSALAPVQIINSVASTASNLSATGISTAIYIQNGSHHTLSNADVTLSETDGIAITIDDASQIQLNAPTIGGTYSNALKLINGADTIAVSGAIISGAIDIDVSIADSSNVTIANLASDGYASEIYNISGGTNIDINNTMGTQVGTVYVLNSSSDVTLSNTPANTTKFGAISIEDSSTIGMQNIILNSDASSALYIHNVTTLDATNLTILGNASNALYAVGSSGVTINGGSLQGINLITLSDLNSINNNCTISNMKMASNTANNSTVVTAISIAGSSNINMSNLTGSSTGTISIQDSQTISIDNTVSDLTFSGIIDNNNQQISYTGISLVNQASSNTIVQMLQSSGNILNNLTIAGYDNGLMILDGANHTIDGLIITDMTHANSLLVVDGTQSFSISNSSITSSSGGTGIQLINDYTNASISTTSISGADIAIESQNNSVTPVSGNNLTIESVTLNPNVSAMIISDSGYIAISDIKSTTSSAKLISMLDAYEINLDNSAGNAKFSAISMDSSGDVTISNTLVANTSGTGISIDQTDAVTITNVTVSGTPQTAISITNQSTDITVNSSSLSAANNAIFIQDINTVPTSTNNVTITNTMINNAPQAIIIGQSNNIQMTDISAIAGTNVGSITLADTDQVVITNALNNTTTFSQFDGSSVTNSGFNNINIMSSITGYATSLSSSTQVAFTNSNIASTSSCLSISGGSSVSFNNLILSGDNTAIALDGTTNVSIANVTNAVSPYVFDLVLDISNNTSGSISGISVDGILSLLKITDNTTALTVSDIIITNINIGASTPVVSTYGDIANLTIDDINFGYIGSQSFLKPMNAGGSLQNITISGLTTTGLFRMIDATYANATAVNNITIDNANISSLASDLIMYSGTPGNNTILNNISVINSTIIGTTASSIISIPTSSTATNVWIQNSNISNVDYVMQIHSDSSNPGNNSNINIIDNNISSLLNVVLGSYSPNIQGMYITGNTITSCSGNIVYFDANTLNATIDSATIEANATASGKAALAMNNVAGLILNNIIISGSPDIGILFDNNAQNITATNVSINAVTTGIRALSNSTNIMIDGTTISAGTNNIELNGLMYAGNPSNIIVQNAQFASSINAMLINNATLFSIDNVTSPSASVLGTISITNSSNGEITNLSGSTTGFDVLVDTNNTNISYTNLNFVSTSSGLMPDTNPTISIDGSTSSAFTGTTVIGSGGGAINSTNTSNIVFNGLTIAQNDLSATVMTLDSSTGAAITNLSIGGSFDNGLVIQNGSSNVTVATASISGGTGASMFIDGSILPVNNVTVTQLTIEDSVTDTIKILGSSNINIGVAGVDYSTNAVDVANSSFVTITHLMPNPSVVGMLGYINIADSSNISIDNSTVPGITYFNGLTLTSDLNITLNNIGINSDNTTGAALTLNDVDGFSLNTFQIIGTAMTGLLLENNSRNISLNNLNIQATTNNLVINSVDGSGNNITLSNIVVQAAPNSLTIDNSSDIVITNLKPDVSVVGPIGYINITNSDNITINDSALTSVTHVEGMYLATSTDLNFSNLGINSSNTTGAALTLNDVNGFALSNLTILGTAMTGLLIENNSCNVMTNNLSVHSSTNGIIVQNINITPPSGYNISITGPKISGSTNAIVIDNSQWIDIESPTKIGSGSLGNISVTNSQNIAINEPAASPVIFSSLLDSNNQNFAYNNLTITNATLTQPVQVIGSNASIADNLTINGTYGGIYFQNGGGGASFTNLKVSTSRTTAIAIEISGSNGIIINTPQMLGSVAQEALLISGGAQNIIVNNASIKVPSTYGIYITGANNVTMNSPTIGNTPYPVYINDSTNIIVNSPVNLGSGTAANTWFSISNNSSVTVNGDSNIIGHALYLSYISNSSGAININNLHFQALPSLAGSVGIIGVRGNVSNVTAQNIIVSSAGSNAIFFGTDSSAIYNVSNVLLDNITVSGIQNFANFYQGSSVTNFSVTNSTVSTKQSFIMAEGVSGGELALNGIIIDNVNFTCQTAGSQYALLDIAGQASSDNVTITNSSVTAQNASTAHALILLAPTNSAAMPIVNIQNYTIDSNELKKIRYAIVLDSLTSTMLNADTISITNTLRPSNTNIGNTVQATNVWNSSLNNITINDPDMYKTTTALYIDNATSLTINGANITGPGNSASYDNTAIEINDGVNVTVASATINDCYMGVELIGNTTNPIIKNSTFIDSDAALWINGLSTANLQFQNNMLKSTTLFLLTSGTPTLSINSASSTGNSADSASMGGNPNAIMCSSSGSITGKITYSAFDSTIHTCP